jgi:uroporphyrinogen decarboxylase
MGTIPSSLPDFLDQTRRIGKGQERSFRLDDPDRKVDIGDQSSTRPTAIILWGGLADDRRDHDMLTFEGLSYAIYDYPLLEDMVETACQMVEQFLDQVLPHFDFDFASGWEDICYKGGPIVSVKFFNRVVVPRYKRIRDRLDRYGIDLWYTDCDGDVRPILPGLMEGGINCLFPFEVNSCAHPPSYSPMGQGPAYHGRLR